MPRFLQRFSRGVLHLLYDVLFCVFLVVSAPWFALRCLRDRRLRSSIAGRFGRGVPKLERPSLWIHGVSVGEVKAAGSLLRDLRRRLGDTPLVVSSTTPAGMEVARSLYLEDQVFQFPLDLSFVVRRVLRRLKPRAIVLLELEVWPNLLREASRRGIPVLVMNGRISERSFRGYRRFRPLVPPFETIALYSVQTEVYADRLRALGVPNGRIRVSGNLKYDNLPTHFAEQDLDQRRRELGNVPGAVLLVAGSTHPGEEEMLLDLVAKFESAVARGGWDRGELRLALVPRHVERAAEVCRAVERRGRRALRLTAIRDGSDGPASPGDIVVVDTIGELDLFYGIAEVVFVGGSMVPRGGHNILEPAALGRPLVFGPHMDNFTEEVRLLLEGDSGIPAGIQVVDRVSLGCAIEGLLTDREAAARMGGSARRVVARIQGTTERNAELIVELLEGVETQGTVPALVPVGPR